MRERILEEIDTLEQMLSRYHYLSSIDWDNFRKFIDAKHKAENPDYFGSRAILGSEFIYYVSSDESIEIKKEIKQFLESIGYDIVILETLKDVGKDFIHHHDYSMNYRDTFEWYYQMNKHYKPEQTVKYFLSKMSLAYIGYLYFGYAASFDFLNAMEGKLH